MGNFFIDILELSKYVLRCKICYTHISHSEYLITNTIETGSGEAIGVLLGINVFCLNEKYSTYTYHGTFDMFDNDSLLTDTGQCMDIYCKKCNNFIGWKHIQCNTKEKYIILKNSII